MFTGKKTRLRAIEPEDLPFLMELANDDKVHGHVVDWAWPVALHGQEAWLARLKADQRSQRLLVEDHEGNRLGLTGLWDIDLRNRSGQSAIKLLGSALNGRSGMATDAIKTILAVAFHELGLHRVWAVILDYNQASMALYSRKAGFTVEGRRRQEVFRKGGFHDLYHLGLLRPEYDALEDSAEYASLVCTADTSNKVDLPEQNWED